MLPIKGNAHAPILSSEVKTRGPLRPALLTDDAALKLVTQDVQRAEAFITQEQWKLFWQEAKILYQSPRVENNNRRANVSRFTVAKHVNTLGPTVMSGIFYDSPPFVLRPRPGTSQDTIRAKTALFDALLSECGFKRECKTGVDSQILNGTGIWKYGWQTRKKIVKKYVRKQSAARVNMPFEEEPQEVHTIESDEFDVQEVEVTESRPFFESKKLSSVLIDPGWDQANDIGKAKFVIERAYVTFNDLNELRGQPGYNIPSEADLKALFFPPVEMAIVPGGVEAIEAQNRAIHHAEARNLQTTEDPLEIPLELLERWDKDRVMVTLQGKLTIRNEEHKLGRIPFLSCNWWDIEGAGYGMGVGRLVGADQRVEAGSLNGALDILSMHINQTYLRNKGSNAPTQNIRLGLGGIIDVDGDPDKAFKILEPPKVPGELFTVISSAQKSSESASGADEAFMQGSLPTRGGSSAGRTATGAGNIAAAAAGRIQGPVGNFVEGVFIPFLIALDEMVNERMPISEIRQILSDELGDALKLDLDNFMNSRLKFEVLAGAHLAAKKAMAQSLPLMIQIFENPEMIKSLNAMGWTIDIKEIFEMFMEMSEWKNSRDVVRRMSKEEQQMFMMMNPAFAKAQAEKAKSDAEFNNESALVDQKREGQLAEKLTMHAVEHSTDPLLTAGDRATGRVARMAMEQSMDPAALGKGQQEFSTQ